MKKDTLEIRIFVCFVLTILYVHYTLLANNNLVEELPVVEEKIQVLEPVIVEATRLKGFEVRIINDYANERLELTDTLGEALDYIESYKDHHEDLVAIDLSTGAQVGSSTNANGVIYSESSVTNAR